MQRSERPRVGEKVVQKIRISSSAGEHSNSKLCSRRIVSRVLQSFPGAFQEDAMLGIGQFGVEYFQAVQQHARLDVVWRLNQLGWHAGGEKLIVGKCGHRLEPRG